MAQRPEHASPKCFHNTREALMEPCWRRFSGWATVLGMRRLVGWVLVLAAHFAHAQSRFPALDATTNSSQVGGSSSNAASGASPTVAAASALILGVGGGISTTVFVGQSKERSRVRRQNRDRD